MLATSKIYQTLIGNDTLISMMTSMRESEVEDENMIFNDQIPEEFQAAQYAPIIRINHIQATMRSADNQYFAEKPSVLVSFWVKSLAQLEELKPVIEKILIDINYPLYNVDYEPDREASQDNPENKLYICRIYVHGIELTEE
ncbi:hypothetical protein QP343_05850 [Lactobacillus jensenii]|jgi:hypothetical protein|uniref:DUF806 family protein n=5 Tax=root TaxID=1 RepID=A0AAW5WWR4_9LACO|nr:MULTISPECIES: hypothetical protein [Lactobacillus]DAD80312.1 MAG TPA: tail component [Siphoviridae sp. ctX581]MCF1850640.1 hypothetical protein [Lactobacillus jensenii]MCW8070823.1 hypothetical protein [Lactobacillus jensenii]MCW8093532.1 hypothetical protein [Lactobacillus mulieris]MCZ3621381.1 hypothetical protein [Lactobacillus mulieris]